MQLLIEGRDYLRAAKKHGMSTHSWPFVNPVETKPFIQKVGSPMAI